MLVTTASSLYNARMPDRKTADRKTNRLIHESSPYLLQHAHNPVDWYAWGEEAFAAARAQNKPIFLSVGYSTCYWCHVMERQSFEVESTAAEMNARFINIKVDREERPDVDQLYMLAVQLMTGQGGWPMSVFLLPDLRPFYGGTYFPPVDSHGRPSFVTLLRAIDEAYRERRDEVEKSAQRLTEMLARYAQPRAPSQTQQLSSQTIAQWITRSIDDFDSTHGGFGGAPKFPRETLLELLLTYQASHPDPKLAAMLRQTLDAMAAGGMRDQLGGAFHRYSTDARWLVPHFEIMLYDNAMLAWIYTESFRQFGESRDAKIAREILEFMLREMHDSRGGFFAAIDAEVDAKEGEPYLWTADEIEALLGEADAKIFNRAFGLDDGPNFVDPHGSSRMAEKNVLFRALEEMDEGRLDSMRKKLYEARRLRKQPLLDTKIITSWNALMIRAFARSGEILGRRDFIEVAEKAANFLWTKHRREDGSLWRTSRDGHAKYGGFLDDYAILAQAFLTLSRVTSDTKTWRDRAAQLAENMSDRFASENGGFYFSRHAADDLIVRQMIATDSPLPSGNAIAAEVLLELGDDRGAGRLIGAFSAQLDQQAESMSALVQTAAKWIDRNGSLDLRNISGGPETIGRPDSPQSAAENTVQVMTKWLDPETLQLELHIAAGFHLNAHETIDGFIATDLKVINDTSPRIDFPPGEIRKLEFSPDPLSVYSERVIVLVSWDAPIESNRVRLLLRYQACDDRACLPIVTKTIDPQMNTDEHG